MLDLGRLDWSIHTAATISAAREPAIAGVLCFWVFAVLAVIGAFTQRARAAPLWLWSIPLLMYLSVVFLVVETPRYRKAIDPFIILLAALAVISLRVRPSRSRRQRTRDGREERAGRRQVSAQLLEREPDLVGAVVAGLRERGPGEVGLARLGPVAEKRRQAEPAVAPVGLLHAGGAPIQNESAWTRATAGSGPRRRAARRRRSPGRTRRAGARPRRARTGDVLMPSGRG